ncbi:41834_t:CDS:2, partial [Gigaspora margarita]
KEVFSLKIQHSNGYSFLQTILNEEFNALIKNLPNLYISYHLVDYTRQYATCINLAVGTKKIQINILQTLRHLVDSKLDDRMPYYSTQSIFMLLIIAPQLHSLLSNWCINDYNLLMHYTNEIFNQLQIEVAGFILTNIESNSLLKDLMKAYLLYYSFDQALLET